MSKTETNDERIKAAYICPNIVCIAVESSICAGSPFLDNGHEPGEPDLNPLEEESLYEDNSEMLY